MTTIDTQLQQCLSRLLPDNPQQVSNILQRLAPQDTVFKEHFLKVLDAEIQKSFFAAGHYEKSLPDVPYFDYAISTEFAALLGMIFLTHDYASLALRPHRISNQCTASQIVSALDKQGYFVFPERLANDFIDRIIAGLTSASFAMYASHKVFRIESPAQLHKVSDNTCWAINQQEVLAIPEVQQLLMDPVLLDAIHQFLGCPPIHVQANSWWSKANETDDRTLNRSAQMFHQDKEFIKFIKVFVYLNDVTEENGPHQFIAGSNKDYREHVPADYQVSQRLSDEYLASVYDPSRFISLTGQKGCVIIEDTSGFHKGMPVISGYRQILQLEFAASLYFNPLPCFSFAGLTPEYLAFLQKNPRFCLNYDDAKYHRDLAANAAVRKNYFKINTIRALKDKVRAVQYAILGKP